MCMMLRGNDVEIDSVDVEIFNNPDRNCDLVILSWVGNIGFGEYTLRYTDGEWQGDSECMDINDDKGFLTLLLQKWVEQITIRS